MADKIAPGQHFLIAPATRAAIQPMRAAEIRYAAFGAYARPAKKHGAFGPAYLFTKPLDIRLHPGRLPRLQSHAGM